jgi:hypothetical protein
MMLLVAQNIYRRMVGWFMSKELERIWKKVVVAWFNLLSHHLSEGTEESKEDLIQDSRSPGRALNLEPPEYEAGVPLLCVHWHGMTS